MANRWTRVPDRPVPDLPDWASGTVPVADAFMWLMASRPGGLSLRSTWVTPATLLLAAAVAVAGVAVEVLAAAGLSGAGAAVELGAVLVGAVLIIGSASVGLVGLGQRRADRRSETDG